MELKREKQSYPYLLVCRTTLNSAQLEVSKASSTLAVSIVASERGSSVVCVKKRRKRKSFTL